MHRIVVLSIFLNAKGSISFVWVNVFTANFFIQSVCSNVAIHLRLLTLLSFTSRDKTRGLLSEHVSSFRWQTFSNFWFLWSMLSKQKLRLKANFLLVRSTWENVLNIFSNKVLSPCHIEFWMEFFLVIVQEYWWMVHPWPPTMAD